METSLLYIHLQMNQPQRYKREIKRLVFKDKTETRMWHKKEKKNKLNTNKKEKERKKEYGEETEREGRETGWEKETDGHKEKELDGRGKD